MFILNTGRFHTQLARQVKGKRAHAYLRRRVTFYRVQGIALALVSGAKPSITEQPSSAVGSLVALTQKEGPAAQQMVQYVGVVLE